MGKVLIIREEEESCLSVDTTLLESSEDLRAPYVPPQSEDTAGDLADSSNTDEDQLAILRRSLCDKESEVSMGKNKDETEDHSFTLYDETPQLAKDEEKDLQLGDLRWAITGSEEENIFLDRDVSGPNQGYWSVDSSILEDILLKPHLLNHVNISQPIHCRCQFRFHERQTEN